MGLSGVEQRLFRCCVAWYSCSQGKTKGAHGFETHISLWDLSLPLRSERWRDSPLCFVCWVCAVDSPVVSATPARRAGGRGRVSLNSLWVWVVPISWECVPKIRHFSRVRSYRSTATGLRGKQPLVLWENVAKGSRQHRRVTLGEALAPAIGSLARQGCNSTIVLELSPSRGIRLFN